MATKPILFSAPMVRALLDGSKTQTRRVVKIDHTDSTFLTYLKRPLKAYNGPEVLRAVFARHTSRFGSEEVTCPYGHPGDQLWVRETWRKACAHADDDTLCLAYRASQEDGKGGLIVNNIPRPAGVERWDTEDDMWRPSIFMPRWASRITLEVTTVRVERLKDISEADAIAEGGTMRRIGSGDVRTGLRDCWTIGESEAQTPVQAYELLWESLNGPGSWDLNPWVWDVSFRRVT